MRQSWTYIIVFSTEPHSMSITYRQKAYVSATLLFADMQASRSILSQSFNNVLSDPFFTRRGVKPLSSPSYIRWRTNTGTATIRSIQLPVVLRHSCSPDCKHVRTRGRRRRPFGSSLTNARSVAYPMRRSCEVSQDSRLTLATQSRMSLVVATSYVQLHWGYILQNTCIWRVWVSVSRWSHSCFQVLTSYIWDGQKSPEPLKSVPDQYQEGYWDYLRGHYLNHFVDLWKWNLHPGATSSLKETFLGQNLIVSLDPLPTRCHASPGLLIHTKGSRGIVKMAHVLCTTNVFGRVPRQARVTNNTWVTSASE